MSNILYCIPNFFRSGGTETRFLSEARNFHGRNKKTYLLVRKNFFDKDMYSSLFNELNVTCLEFDFGEYGNIKDTISLVSFIIETIQSFKIGYVFANYNHTIFASSIACHITHTKLICTYHISDKIHSSKKFEDYFFNYYILPKSNLNLCVSKEVYQQKKSYGTDNCIYAPNLIDKNIFHKKNDTNANQFYWTIVSRLDANKLPGILAFIDLLVSHKNIMLKICGDGNAKQELESYISDKNMTDRVDFLGTVSQKVVATTMQYSLGVAGVGRVVIESAMLGKPTVILGYERATVKGLLSKSNIETFGSANFTGRNYSSKIPEDLFDIDYIQKHLEELDGLSRYFQDHFILDEGSYLDLVFEDDGSFYKNEFLYTFYSELTLYQSSITESIWRSGLVKNNIFRRLMLSPKYYSFKKEQAWNYFGA